MRRATAKEILAGSFREIAREKNVDRITVKDITDRSGYSTATFYRQFQDKYDLIAWDYAQQIKQIMSHMGEGDHPWRDILLDAAQNYARQREYLANLLCHTSGMDAFIEYMREINYGHMKEQVLKNKGSEELDEKTEMYIRIYVLGTVQLTCEWILGRFHVSPEVLAEIYENSLPEPLRTYLL